MAFWDRWFKPKAVKADSLGSPLAQSGQYSISGYGSGRLRAILLGGLPGTNIDFANEAGDLTLSSAVAACLGFYCDNWPQAKLRVKRGDEYVDDHPILALLANPMPDRQIQQRTWWEWMLTDWWCLGNGYIYKVRGAGGVGVPVALQWLAGDMVAPWGTGRLYPLAGYTYRVDGNPVPLKLNDVIHARQGRDPNDWRVGRARLASVLREIATDNQGSTMAFAIAKNKGHMSMLVGPSDKAVEATDPISSAEGQVIERRLNETVSGDAFGSVKFWNDGFHAEQMSFSPKELDLSEMRRKPEERIAAIFRVPPAVVGFSVSDAATYNNTHLWRQQAWEDGIMPAQQYWAELLTQFLLPDFPETMPGDVLEWDYSDVRALADDVVANAQRATSLYKAGVVDRATAKRIAGEEPLPEDEGIYAPSTAGDGSVPEPPPMMGSGGAIPAKSVGRFRR